MMTDNLRNNKIKIVFFGTPEFAVESLDKLVSNDFDIAAVVTMPDKIAGRGHKLLQSDVKKYAQKKGLPILQPENLKSPEFVSQLREINADLFIVIAFRMLPEIVWNMPRLGTFNLHASLLPKYRGAAPINHAVINGDKETGITTFFLKHEIDTGDIIRQEKVEIRDEENVGNIHDKLMYLGAEMVLETVKEIENGTVKSYPQPEGDFTPAPKIFKDTCKIHWNDGAVKIHNLIRGLSPYPAAWARFKDERNLQNEIDVKIFSSKPASNSISDNGKPGEVLILKDRLFVYTGDGLLEILSLQPAGKKLMEASAFLRGYKPQNFS